MKTILVISSEVVVTLCLFITLANSNPILKPTKDCPPDSEFAYMTAETLSNMDVAQVDKVNNYTLMAIERIMKSSPKFLPEWYRWSSHFDDVIARGLIEEDVSKVWVYKADDHSYIDYIVAFLEKTNQKLIKSTLKDTFERQIVQPCEYFLKNIKSPINKWKKCHPYGRADKQEVERLSEFYLVIYRYRICEQLVEKDHKNILKELTKYAL